eukprot:451143_1
MKSLDDEGVSSEPSQFRKARMFPSLPKSAPLVGVDHLEAVRTQYARARELAARALTCEEKGELTEAKSFYTKAASEFIQTRKLEQRLSSEETRSGKESYLSQPIKECLKRCIEGAERIQSILTNTPSVTREYSTEPPEYQDPIGDDYMVVKPSAPERSPSHGRGGGVRYSHSRSRPDTTEEKVTGSLKEADAIFKKAKFHDERSMSGGKNVDSAVKALQLYDVVAPMYLAILKDNALPHEVKLRLRPRLRLVVERIESMKLGGRRRTSDSSAPKKSLTRERSSSADPRIRTPSVNPELGDFPDDIDDFSTCRTSRISSLTSLGPTSPPLRPPPRAAGGLRMGEAARRCSWMGLWCEYFSTKSGFMSKKKKKKK